MLYNFLNSINSMVPQLIKRSKIDKEETYGLETIEEVVEVVDGTGGTAFPDVDVWL